MARLYNEANLKAKTANQSWLFSKSIDRLILENNERYKHFDIFLSHSSLDKEVVYGLMLDFLEMGYTAYIYWIIDKAMVMRNTVDKKTVQNLRERLNQSDTLFYATTKNTIKSKWMPWELGYMDGRKGTCAILPIAKGNSTLTSFRGQEYLSLYPYVVKEAPRFLKNNTGKLWICDSRNRCTTFDEWKQGRKPKPLHYPLYSD